MQRDHSMAPPGGGGFASRSRYRKMVRGSTPRSRAVWVRLPLLRSRTSSTYLRWNSSFAFSSGRIGALGLLAEVEVLGAEQRLLAEDERLLDAVLELPDVARPGALLDGGERLRREALHVRRRAPRRACESSALAMMSTSSPRSRSGGQVDVDDVEPVVEVLAEAPGADLVLEDAVGRGDDADVDLLGLAVADAEDDALLQRAQQLHLQVERQLADLVEEERAAVGRLELAGPRRDGAGEGALHVPEELTLDEVLGDGAAVDDDERPVRRGCERRWISRAMSSLPVPVSPVMSTEMSVVATFCSLRNTSSIDGHAPMISPKRLSFSSATSFSLSARSALRSIAFCRMRLACDGEDGEHVELVAVEEALDAVVADVEHALHVPLATTSGAHMTLERRSARTLSLVLNCESLSASLTMTGRPVSRTLRTMLSLMAPAGASAMASRLTLRDARMRCPVARRGASAGASLARRPRRPCGLRRERVVVQQDEALLGAGDLDDGVEHRLEELVDLLHRHQLLAELVELAEAGQLLVGDVELRVADGRRRRRRRSALRRSARPSAARRRC